MEISAVRLVISIVALRKPPELYL